MTTPLYLADVVAYIPSLGTTTTLRYSSGPFTTKSGDTPASTWYDPRLSQPVDVTRNLFTGGTTQGGSKIAIGDLRLANPDGMLDGLVEYGFDGRALTVWVTTVLVPSYPSDFTKVFVGTMAQAEFSATQVTLKVRDLLANLTLPLQTTKYAGTNVLPAGLEGVSDLQGKPKPLLFGGPVYNISPPCVNTDKLIYQVNDGAVASISTVYDRGVPLAIGLAWTSRTSGVATVLTGVVYGNGLWVVSGEGGVILTSPDGTTWTSRTSGFGATNIFNVTYGGGMFVAVGAGGTLTSSPDGITWTGRTSGFGATAISGVGYGGGLFVATGLAGTLTTSPDGITWTARTSSFGVTPISLANYRTGQWVAVGNSGKLATSPDGITWTQQTTAAAFAIRAVVYAQGTWVIGDAAGNIETSPDAITWTLRANAQVVVTTLAYANGLFFVGGNSGILQTSPDGIAWTTQTTNFGTTLIRWLAFDGSGLFVMVGNGGTIGTTTSAAGTYANTTDLQDDTLAPARGTYKVYLAGGYFRLGASPVGTITCDATQGATAADRTAAQLWSAVLARTGAVAV